MLQNHRYQFKKLKYQCNSKYFVPPILFIHYGPAYYLRWALGFARRSNPGKRIILLGDSTNKHIARGLAEFVDFKSLGGTQKEQEFQRVCQVIQGERHRFNKANGGEFWLKFVFRCRFLLEGFLGRENSRRNYQKCLIH